MNRILLLIVLVPLIEVYLLIKIGYQIGALNTIYLILFTAIVGVSYAKYEGLNTLKSAIKQLKNDETPVYEIISGAALAFAAFLLILPGFITDLIGLLIIFPPTRKLFFKTAKKNYPEREKNFIEGEYEDIDEDKNGKI